MDRIVHIFFHRVVHEVIHQLNHAGQSHVSSSDPKPVDSEFNARMIKALENLNIENKSVLFMDNRLAVPIYLAWAMVLPELPEFVYYTGWKRLEPGEKLGYMQPAQMDYYAYAETIDGEEKEPVVKEQEPGKEFIVFLPVASSNTFSISTWPVSGWPDAAVIINGEQKPIDSVSPTLTKIVVGHKFYTAPDSGSRFILYQ
jgi:hypothetical protein